MGVLPGIGPATAVAMLLPITLKVEPTASMIFFAGIYYGVAALLAGLAAYDRHRFSARLHPCCWKRYPDLPELCNGEETLQTQRGIRHGGRHRRRGRPGSGQQHLHHGDPDPVVDVGHLDLEHHSHPFGAFQNHGIQPGPQLFEKNGALVWALIASLYIGNVMLLILNLPLFGLWVKLLKMPRAPLYVGILIFPTVGVYGMRQSAFDLVLRYVIGLLGVVMRRFDFPTAPVVVGMILGPLVVPSAAKTLRRSGKSQLSPWRPWPVRARAGLHGRPRPPRRHRASLEGGAGQSMPAPPATQVGR